MSTIRGADRKLRDKLAAADPWRFNAPNQRGISRQEDPFL